MPEKSTSVSNRGVPVTILTGFLGAGKTTLLNRILSGNHGLRIAVLVNDFGSINIDADLVVGVESGGDIVSLANGCVCCNIRDDLLLAVQQVIERPEQPECIVLEASGVAEPSGIAVTFTDAKLRDRIRLDSIVCVVDAAQIFAVPELMDLKLRQIAFADMLILNKVDLVSRDEVARIRAWLDEHFHRYRLVEAMRGEVPLEILLSCGRFDPNQLDNSLRHHRHECEDEHCNHEDHAKAFSTWSFETDQPFLLDALRLTAKKLSPSIYRCKGIVYSIDAPRQIAVLQVVGKRVDISLGEAWCQRSPQSQIVAIGAYGMVDAKVLHEQFSGCLVNRT